MTLPLGRLGLGRSVASYLSRTLVATSLAKGKMSRHVYSNSEYYEMMLCVGAARNNSINEARQIYRRRFIEGRPPAEQRHLQPYSVFRNMCLRLQRTGSFHAGTSSPSCSLCRTQDKTQCAFQCFYYYVL